MEEDGKVRQRSVRRAKSRHSTLRTVLVRSAQTKPHPAPICWGWSTG